ncbi:hypothetical protein KP509_08G063400 [Ceratopteris richardii]|nr:hypothetical protein KP509_08G063400 [Ceratopteris richardii]
MDPISYESEVFLTSVPFDSTGYMPLYTVRRLTYTKQIEFKEDAEPMGRFCSFETSFAFRIETSTKYNESGDGITFVIQVWATNESHTQRPPTPILSLHINPTQVFGNETALYVGITASSGNNSQRIVVLSWDLNTSKITIPPESSSSRTDSSKHHLPLISLVSVLILAIVIFLAVQRSQVKKLRSEKKAIETASTCFHRYKYTILRRATQNFSEKQIVGKGMSSTVYKGVLPDKTMIAVKRMRDGLMEPDAIVKEIHIISKIRHRNLLELQGWCFRKGETLLVYKYMPNGSLDQHLYGDKRRSGEVLDSRTRFRIIMDVASGLQYLHNQLDDCVLHRDVKPANVLLTQSMEAKLGDFGLARLLARDEEAITLARGTAGYIPPEAYRQNKVTDKTDVYSFGVLMLETACGKRAYDSIDSDNEHIADRVRAYHQTTDIMDALDPSIREMMVIPDRAQVPANHLEGNEVAAEQAMIGENTMDLQRWRCVLQLGLACCEDDPHDRPSMSNILRTLEDCMVIPPAKLVRIHDPG